MKYVMNKKIKKAISVAILLLVVAVILNVNAAYAKEPDAIILKNNYALSITACGNASADGYSAIFGEGKTLTFDMLKTIDKGEIGVFTASDKPTDNLDGAKKEKVAFKDGFNYKLERSGNKIILSRRGFYDSDYEKVTDVVVTNGGYMGVYVKSDKQFSASCVIDNFVMTGGSKNVTVTFDNNKDTSDKLVTLNGFIEKSDKIIYTVSFMTKDGEFIAKQKVSEYNYAALPDAPEKEGYYFKGYTRGYERVTDNVTCYAEYAEGEEPVPPKPDGNDKKGCGASSAVLTAVLASALALAFVGGKRK